MKCPACNDSFWGLYACADGVHRCYSCRAKTPVVVVAQISQKKAPAPVAPIKQHRQARIRAMGLQYTEIERRDRNLCVVCEQPAIYYGEVAGHGLKCEKCAEDARAKARERRARHSVAS